ncbi:MAG: heavy metal translocating P-type ATPase, partial [Aureliella sp.]
MHEKTKISLNLLLPGIPDHEDRCVERLIDSLRAKQGIADAHVIQAEHPEPGKLCIHFQPDELSLAEVEQAAQRAGATLDATIGHVLLRSRPMHARLATAHTAKLSGEAGILEAVVAPDGTVRVEFDKQTISEEKVLAILSSLGLEPSAPSAAWLAQAPTREPTVQADARFAKPEKLSAKAHRHGDEHAAPGKACEHGPCGHEHGGILGPNTELIFAIVGGVCLLVGWIASFFDAVSPWIPWAFYVATYLCCGWFMLREAIERLSSGRFEIDSLMIIAAAGAAYLDKWAEGALLLFLFSIGHSLESFAMGRAKRAIEALTKLAPPTALVKRNGQATEIPVEELRIGDVVVVKPNERISADGLVVSGTSSVNQAPVTGESVPVDKQPVDDAEAASRQPEKLDQKHRVYAGTINGSGTLEIRVTRLARENTLARVIEMVGQAETRISPTQKFTTRLERTFVPAVLGFVGLLLFAWVVIDEPFSASLYRAMSVVVAASPCALAIATPSAVLSGIARAARGGVLVKGGGPLESLGLLESIAFDKTGTLTEGKPRLTDVVAMPGSSEEELLQVAVAVEQLSDHPLAAAVVRDGGQRLEGGSTLAASNLQSVTGRGVRAQVGGASVAIGKETLFTDGADLPDDVRTAVEHLKEAGRTTMIVRRDEDYLGVLGLMDTPRAGAKEVIAHLQRLGVKNMTMLSGDNQQVATAVAESVGLK